jgi:L-malate glycosyltransferase
VIPPGIGLPNPDVLRAARRQRDRTPTVASAGRLEEERRFDVLIRAIPDVRSVFPSCRFAIIGSGTDEAHLRELAVAVGAEDSITWTGWLPQIAPVLAASNIYVNTWPFEGFGMATAEAMACGLPVIVTKTGASVELIEGGTAGVAVDPVAPTALARAICDLLGNTARAEDLGRKGAELITRYSVHHTALAMAAFYRELTGSISREPSAVAANV